MSKSPNKRGPKTVAKKVFLSVSVMPSTKILLASMAESTGLSASYHTEQALQKYLQNNHNNC